MFFREKKKPPLDAAVDAARQVREIVQLHTASAEFIPTPEEMRLLEALEQQIWRDHIALMNINRALRERK